MYSLEAKARLLSFTNETPLTEFHGHVVPLPSGIRAKCGGPDSKALRCAVCARERDLFVAGKHPLKANQEHDEFMRDLKRTFFAT